MIDKPDFYGIAGGLKQYPTNTLRINNCSHKPYCHCVIKVLTLMTENDCLGIKQIEARIQ